MPDIYTPIDKTSKSGHEMLYQYYTMTATQIGKMYGIVAVFYCENSGRLYQLMTINNTITTEQAALQDLQTYLATFICH